MKDTVAQLQWELGALRTNIETAKPQQHCAIRQDRRSASNRVDRAQAETRRKAHQSG